MDIIGYILNQYNKSILQLVDDIENVNTGDTNKDLELIKSKVREFSLDRLNFSTAYYEVVDRRCRE